MIWGLFRAGFAGNRSRRILVAFVITAAIGCVAEPNPPFDDAAADSPDQLAASEIDAAVIVDQAVAPMPDPPDAANVEIKDLAFEITDLACNQFGHDPGCLAASDCARVFVNGPFAGTTCKLPGRVCWFWCNMHDGWEIECDQNGVTRCTNGNPKCPDVSWDLKSWCW